MKLSYATLLFDLDGTLTDSAEGILNCVHHALKPFGIKETDPKRLYSFIGPPLADSFKRLYDFDDEKIKTALKLYRDRYQEKGKFENRVYEGVPELLDSLKAAGYRLILATAKPEHFTAQIMEHFDLTRRFDFIYGSNESKNRLNKTHVIRDIKLAHPDLTSQNTIMIGDRNHDVLGAKANGIESIGVLYGFGDRQELEEAGAKYIVATVSDLKNLLV